MRLNDGLAGICLFVLEPAGQSGFLLARTLSRQSAVEVWPAFTDAMLAFVLVLVLMLAYQVGASIEIAGPSQAKVVEDQRRVEAIVDGLGFAGMDIETGLGRQDITLGQEVLFASAGTDLGPEGKRILAALASAVANEGVSTLREIQVAGHTDTEPTARATNWELSSSRATNVVRYLAEAGIDPARVRLSGTGYGEFAPVQPNTTAAGRDANRRIEMRLLYDLSGAR
ncbi:MAG TPA: OmpA family protein [Rubricoccaceae bacterium]|jgi:chemotaxis protein MotB